MIYRLYKSRCQLLSSSVLELQFRKKKLGNEVFNLSSYISQVEKLRKRHSMEIDLKREIISDLDRQLNQKSDALQEKISRNSPNSNSA